jgi:hypothetical protein
LDDGVSKRRGAHAADDGSFGKSAAVNAGRGAILILVALVIGVILLQDYDDGPDNVNVESSPEATAPDTTQPLATLAPTTTLAVRQAKDVKVLVVNGTSVSGAAARVSTPLRNAGYNVLAPVDASPSVKANTSASVVYYTTKEYEREAKQLQQDLDLPPAPVTAVPSPPPTADLRGANVVILVGPDLAGSRSSTGTTTTTRKATTTTG